MPRGMNAPRAKGPGMKAPGTNPPPNPFLHLNCKFSLSLKINYHVGYYTFICYYVCCAHIGYNYATVALSRHTVLLGEGGGGAPILFRSSHSQNVSLYSEVHFQSLENDFQSCFIIIIFCFIHWFIHKFIHSPIHSYIQKFINLFKPTISYGPTAHHIGDRFSLESFKCYL